MPELYSDDYLWNPRAAPDAEIVRFEEALRGVRLEAVSSLFASTKLSRRIRTQTIASRFRWPLGAAASALVLIGALAVTRAVTRPWAVVTLRDTDGWMPAIGTRATVTTGEWIETDADTRARLNVGALGKAEIGPSSRVRLIRAALTEHRLELAEGTLRARIWAPPRFFLLQTPSAVAVDLGCAYTMHVDRFGTGYLRVESGEVELVGQRHRSLVPAGNTVNVSQTGGPGLPHSDRSPPEFIRALSNFEKNQADSTSLNLLLREAGPSATITLWHLIPRVGSANRVAVARRLTELAPLPPDVVLDQILTIDPSSMASWKKSMQGQWSSENVHFWKRWWRAVWLRPLSPA